MTLPPDFDPRESFSTRLRLGLYLITDASLIHDLTVPEAVEKAILGGLKLVQYREKNLSPSKCYEVAEMLRRLTRKAGAIFIVNDDVSLALAVDADGVHLGQEDLPIQEARKILGHRKLIGVSTHSVQEALAAEQAGADYIGLGPIYSTTTKQTRPPLGCGVIRRAIEEVKIPVFAIGGINRTNLREVLMAGATGVAIVSVILNDPDITQASRDLLELVASVKRPNHAEPTAKASRLHQK